MKLKIMLHNILNGFYSPSTPFIHQIYRQKAAIKVVEDENPDILILNEASFAFTSKFNILQDYQKIFPGFAYYYLSQHGDRAGTVILSKFKMRFEDYSMSKRVFARALFKMDDKEVMLDITHPHPEVSEWDKEKFFKSILRDKKNPYLFVGDLNSISPQDKYNKNKLIKGFSTFTNGENVVNSLWLKLGTSYLLNEGLIDTYKIKNKKFDYTIPTDFLSKNKDSGVRIDYIFCSSDFNVIESGIIKNEFSEKASDHYPIYAVLELK